VHNLTSLTYVTFHVLQEEKQKVYRKEKKKDRKRHADEAGLDDDANPDMSALMGFSGFGTTKK